MRRSGGWTDRYWDVLDQLYWSPQYLGMTSIPQRHWSVRDDMVSLPIEMVNRDGPLYRRTRSGEAYWSHVQRQEETLNHVLNLCLALLPGSVLSQLLLEPAGGPPDPELRGLGRELRTRLGWRPTDNIAQPDGFFLSGRSILCLEIKLRAATSLDQIVKYVCLMAAEQERHGIRPALRLLYVTPDGLPATLERQIGLGAGLSELSRHDGAQAASEIGNRFVRSFVAAHEAAFRDSWKRLEISVLSWESIASGMAALAETLGDGPGDRTLAGLLDGTCLFLRDHPLTQVALTSAHVSHQ